METNAPRSVTQPEIEVSQMDVDALAALGLIEHPAIRELRAELAAAQATIAEMREVLGKALRWFQGDRSVLSLSVLRKIWATLDKHTDHSALNKIKAEYELQIYTLRGLIQALHNCDVTEHLPVFKNSVTRALNLPANQDALHEALAKECERLRDKVDWVDHGIVRDMLDAEAAAHRARKEGK